MARLIRVGIRTVQFALGPRDSAPGGIMGAVGGFVEQSPEISPLTDAALRDLARQVGVGGTRLAITAVPSKYVVMTGDRTHADRQFAAHVARWATANGVDFIDLRPTFDAYLATRRPTDPLPFFVSDIHPNETGHRLIADAIQRHFPDYFPGK